MPPAGTGSVGTTGNRFRNFRVLHLKEKQRNNPCLSPGVFPGLRVRGRVQQHLRVRAHRRPLCQPAVLRVRRCRGRTLRLAATIRADERK